MAIDEAPTAQDVPGALIRPGSRSTEGAARPRLYVLDGLRLVAAAGVMAYHYMGARSLVWHDPQRVFPGVQRVAGYGWLGVEFFFLISGFVICMSAWGRPLSSFFRSRVVRLFPAYWFAVFATSAVRLLIPYPGRQNGRPTFSEIFTNLTMLQSPLQVTEIDHVYWTLWSEMRFYLIFAVVVWMGLSYRRVLNFCWLWLLVGILAPRSGIPLLATMANTPFAPLFAGGIALYVIRREGRRRPEPWALLGFSWLLAQHNMISRVNSPTAGVPTHMSWTVAVALLTMMYLVMTAVACGYLDWIKWRGLVVAGAMSYPFYLLHNQIGMRLLGAGKGSFAAGLLVVMVAGAMLLLAWLVQRFVERPVAKRLRAILS